MPRQPIHSDHAPAAIGPYSQAVRAGDTVYLSGQIPLDPASGQLVEGGIAAQARRAFDNPRPSCEAAGGSLDDVVRGPLPHRSRPVRRSERGDGRILRKPYPARSTIEVPALPKGATFEVDAVMVLRVMTRVLSCARVLAELSDAGCRRRSASRSWRNGAARGLETLQDLVVSARAVTRTAPR